MILLTDTNWRHTFTIKSDTLDSIRVFVAETWDEAA